jgi:hypothetical protein
MAKRQGVRKVDSEEVQGKGSYVKVRPIPYKDSRAAVNVGDDVSTGEKADMVTDLIVNSLIEWDWVDYDGEPLPLPTTTEEMAEILTTDEVNFLTRDLLGSAERSKN